VQLQFNLVYFAHFLFKFAMRSRSVVKNSIMMIGFVACVNKPWAVVQFVILFIHCINGIVVNLVIIRF